MRQLKSSSQQFAGLTLAEITADRISQARDKLSAETFTRGKPRKDKKTGEMVAPKSYKRTGATTNRYIATLSHMCSFAVKERRLFDRNPVGDIAARRNPGAGLGFCPMRNARRFSMLAPSRSGRPACSGTAGDHHGSAQRRIDWAALGRCRPEERARACA